MAVRTDAPHWSLWMLDRILSTLELPAADVDPSKDWEAGWTIYEVDNTKRRTMLEGSLHLDLEVHKGKSTTMHVVQDITMFWRFVVKTDVKIGGSNDALPAPATWEGTSVSQTHKGDVAETRAEFNGIVKNQRIEDLTGGFSVDLPKGAPLTTSWGVLAGLPRLVAEGKEEHRFAMVDELVAVRPNQLLERFEAVEIPMAAGTVSLTRWRQYGTGTPPIQYFCNDQGWPMIVCGLRRAMVLTYLQAGTGGAP